MHQQCVPGSLLLPHKSLGTRLVKSMRLLIYGSLRYSENGCGHSNQYLELREVTSLLLLFISDDGFQKLVVEGDTQVQPQLGEAAGRGLVLLRGEGGESGPQYTQQDSSLVLRLPFHALKKVKVIRTTVQNYPQNIQNWMIQPYCGPNIHFWMISLYREQHHTQDSHMWMVWRLHF